MTAQPLFDPTPASLAEAVAPLLGEEFSGVARDEVLRCIEQAADELRGSVLPSAMPELVTRLVRMRLTAGLLDGDADAAADLAAATTLAEVAKVCRVLARARMDCDGVTFVLREAEHCFYADEDSIAPLWAGQRFPLLECVSGWAMLHSEPAVIDDIDHDERIPLEVYRATYVRSLVIVPVPGVTAASAAIGAYWAQRYRAGCADLEPLLRLAAAAGAAVTRIGLAGAPSAPRFGAAARAARR